MTLTLHFHPLSCYCQKVLIALYENGTAFTLNLVDLGDRQQREALVKLWPTGRFPVLQDDDRVVPESSIIIDYLDRAHPGPVRLIPEAPDQALETRLQDRFFDLDIADPMQRIVGDRLRPADAKDPFGVEKERQRLRTAYGILETILSNRRWAAGEAFTMADCAAAPALYYADLVEPFSGTHPALAAYFKRLLERPSFARAVEEAGPYRHLFPKG